MSIFYEAIAHSRRKTQLKEILTREFQDVECYAGLSFDEIYQRVAARCSIGPLHIYDIAAAICRHHRIQIDHVYIVGRGPKRAVQLLRLKTKTRAIHGATVRYIELPDVIRALTEHGADIPHSTNGDDFESYLCMWQRTQPK